MTIPVDSASSRSAGSKWESADGKLDSTATAPPTAMGSGQKPRFLPAGDAVMSAEIAWSNFSQINQCGRMGRVGDCSDGCCTWKVTAGDVHTVAPDES